MIALLFRMYFFYNGLFNPWIKVNQRTSSEDLSGKKPSNECVLTEATTTSQQKTSILNNFLHNPKSILNFHLVKFLSDFICILFVLAQILVLLNDPDHILLYPLFNTTRNVTITNHLIRLNRTVSKCKLDNFKSIVRLLDVFSMLDSFKIYMYYLILMVMMEVIANTFLQLLHSENQTDQLVTIAKKLLATIDSGFDDLINKYLCALNNVKLTNNSQKIAILRCVIHEILGDDKNDRKNGFNCRKRLPFFLEKYYPLAYTRFEFKTQRDRLNNKTNNINDTQQLDGYETKNYCYYKPTTVENIYKEFFDLANRENAPGCFPSNSHGNGGGSALGKQAFVDVLIDKKQIYSNYADKTVSKILYQTPNYDNVKLEHNTIKFTNLTIIVYVLGDILLALMYINYSRSECLMMLSFNQRMIVYGTVLIFHNLVYASIFAFLYINGIMQYMFITASLNQIVSLESALEKHTSCIDGGRKTTFNRNTSSQLIDDAHLIVDNLIRIYHYILWKIKAYNDMTKYITTMHSLYIIAMPIIVLMFVARNYSSMNLFEYAFALFLCSLYVLTVLVLNIATNLNKQVSVTL